MGVEKRIKDLTAASSITNNDYLAMDNANNSAAKKTSAMPLKNVQGSNDAYSSSKAYNVGDLVIYNNQLYRCNTACSAASWSTNSGYFDAVTLTDAVNQLNNDLNFIVKNWTAPSVKTVPANNGYETFYTNITIPSGYSVIGLFNFTTGAEHLVLSKVTYDEVRVLNPTSTARNTQPSMSVLFAKTSIISTI